jgi:hypothetical protein
LLSARITLPTEFYQTQSLPNGVQTATIFGTEQRWISVEDRAYLERAPQPADSSPLRDLPVAYRVDRDGAIRPVVKCDVESLYPSIMHDRNIASRTDVLKAILCF